MSSSSASSLPSPSNRTLVTSLLAGPVVWSLHFLLLYGLGEFGCLSGRLDYAFAGGHVLAWSAGLLTLLALVEVGLIARGTWRLWCRSRGDGRELARSRFVALVGLLLSAVFGLAILLGATPYLVLWPCQP